MNVCIIMRPKCEHSGCAIHIPKNGTIKDTVGKNSRCRVRCVTNVTKKVYLYKECNIWISEQRHGE